MWFALYHLTLKKVNTLYKYVYDDEIQRIYSMRRMRVDIYIIIYIMYCSRKYTGAERKWDCSIIYGRKVNIGRATMELISKLSITEATCHVTYPTKKHGTLHLHAPSQSQGIKKKRKKMTQTNFMRNSKTHLRQNLFLKKHSNSPRGFTKILRFKLKVREITRR